MNIEKKVWNSCGNNIYMLLRVWGKFKYYYVFILIITLIALIILIITLIILIVLLITELSWDVISKNRSWWNWSSSLLRIRTDSMKQEKDRA